MDSTTLIQLVGVYGAAAAVCLVSGLVPLVNAELFLMGVVAVAPGTHVVVLAACGALGQMLAKTLMYWSSRGALTMSLARYERKVEKWRHRFARREPGLSAFMCTSALVGLPPFFVTTILAGLCRVPFVRVLAAGFLGRFVRFLACALFPRVMMELF